MIMTHRIKRYLKVGTRHYVLWAIEVEQGQNLFQGQISNFHINFTFEVNVIDLIMTLPQNHTTNV